MPDIPENEGPGIEGQDEAETFDETNLTPDGEDIANADELPDVLDVTTADGDEADEADEPEEADIQAVDAVDDDEGSPETRLETEPEDATSVADLEEEDEAVSLASPDDVDAGTLAEDDEGVTTEDAVNPNRFEGRGLSDEDLQKLGYRD